MQRPDYLGAFYQTLRDGVTAAQNGAQLAIQQQSLDLQRERLRFEERQAQQLSPPSYHDAHPNEAAWRINQDVKDAIAACRALHEDCAKLQGMMDIIAGAVQPDWKRLTMAEYVECLYVIAKHATFGEKARELLAQAPATPSK